MKRKIGELLHIPCAEHPYGQTEMLPSLLRDSYQFKLLSIAGVQFLCAQPKEKINLVSLRKHRRKLEETTNLICAFLLETISAYSKRKLIQEGIPFILKNKELYLPFLGIVLTGGSQKDRVPPVQFSFITQKLLLMALYQDITVCSVTEYAGLLGVSKMSVTRSFDELDSLRLGLIKNGGTSGRYFIWDKSKKELWNVIRPFLRNPVKTEYLLDCLPACPLPKSGMSAVSRFLALADTACPTFAMSKQAARRCHPERLPQAPDGERPAAVIQVMGYDYLIESGGEPMVDPVSAMLSLKTAELENLGTEEVIKAMIEESLWPGQTHS